MIIDEQLLLKEKESLKKDFDLIQNKIKETESAIVQLKNNLNAIYGAIQQTDKMLKIIQGDDKKMTAEKAQALNVATS
jgi:chromosome segregation ATPase